MRISGKISNQNNGLLIYLPMIGVANNPANIFQLSLGGINSLRENLISLFSKTLPSPSSSLLLVIIFDIKERMLKDFSGNLKATGVFTSLPNPE